MFNPIGLGKFSGFLLLIFRLSIGSLRIFSLSYNISWFAEWTICSIQSSNILITFYIDWMSLSFLALVTFISGLILWYRDLYIRGDPFLNRFLLIVLLFVASIGFLIIRPNLIRILLGWDGLGLVSYCLVIYYQRQKSYGAGIITALSNRVGDVMILIAITGIFTLGRWNYIFHLRLNHAKDWPLIVVITLLIVAAITKRAQIPFSAWLPAAMAAPTPVSSLVHSSTLVTAGVYLIIRFNEALIQTSGSRILFLIASLTIFIAGLGANFETDLKKVIALSTLRQLGLIMGALSLGLSSLAFFHLLTHALFKALLFICAGNIIHSLGDNQDIRWIGGLGLQIPITSACFAVSNLALCGFPFLAGFYSKDAILEAVSADFINWIGVILFLVSTGLTVRYTTRLILLAVSGPSGGKPNQSWGEESWGILYPIIVLSLGAIIGGRALGWNLFPTPVEVFLPFRLRTLALQVTFLGVIIGFYIGDIQAGGFNKIAPLSEIKGFVGNIWFLPGISTKGIIRPRLISGKIYIERLDQGWGEELGPQGLYSRLIILGGAVDKWQNYSIKSTLFGIGCLTFRLGCLWLINLL